MDTKYDITELSKANKEEIASYIKRDNFQTANMLQAPVHVKKTVYTRVFKRWIDFVVALVAFILTLPVNLVIGIVTWFDVGRPIIFRQTRIGKNRRPFTIIKFRNMTNDVDTNGELLPPGQRVTKWGGFVRKTSLDELLNFVSILRGDMSLIGPRPLLDTYEERLSDRHKAMYEVRPGLECPPLGKIDHPLSWEERFENYVWYVENCSLIVDIKLAFRVVSLALDKKSTAIRSAADNGGFLGYGPDGHVIYTKSVPACYVDEFCRNHGYSDLQDAISKRITANAVVVG